MPCLLYASHGVTGRIIESRRFEIFLAETLPQLGESRKVRHEQKRKFPKIRTVNHREMLSDEHHTAFFDANLDGARLEIGGNPTSHTPAHNVPAVAAAFRL